MFDAICILNDTSNATDRVFCYNFKTARDIDRKFSGTIEKFMRRARKAKSCQQTFNKKHPGRLDNYTSFSKVANLEG